MGTDTAYEVYDIHVSGKYAYLAAESDGVVILDISDPTSTSLVGIYDYPGANRVESIHISGNYAYAGNRAYTGKLQIVDISNTSQPLLADIPWYLSMGYRYIRKTRLYG